MGVLHTRARTALLLGAMALAGASPHAWATDDGNPANTVPASVDRGRQIATSRTHGLCVLCHALPGLAAHEVGTLGPDLSGVATRHDAATLRRRLVEPDAFNPSTIMPSYGRVNHPGARVPTSRQGQALLDEQSLADVLAYLGSLK